jgi:hypothetical protein
MPPPMVYEGYKAPVCAMTPEDVFGVLINWRRLGYLHNELALIDPEMTVQQYLNEYEFVGMNDLEKSLNEWFAISISEQEWRAALKPAKTRTLRDICELISRHARRRCIEPVCVLGCSCRKAGAFLAVRQILAESGLDVSELRPTSELKPFISRWNPRMINELVQLAPGMFPPVREHTSAREILMLSNFGCGIISIVARCAGLTQLNVTMIVSCSVLFLLTLVARWVQTPQVDLGWVRTFKDLCRVLVGECPVYGPSFEVIVPPRRRQPA